LIGSITWLTLLMDTLTEQLSNANPLSAEVSLHGLINDSYKWLDMDVTNLKRYSVIYINNNRSTVQIHTIPIQKENQFLSE